MSLPHYSFISQRRQAPQASSAAVRSPRLLSPGALAALAAAALFTGCMTVSSNRSSSDTSSDTHSTGSGIPRVIAANDSSAGQYLTLVGGCNDCHTVGWAESNGKTAPADQLTGSPVGYRGPWGTTYAANLRTVVQRASEDRWVQILTTADGGHGRPPMPWMNTAQMSDHDLRAIYRYIHSLGAAGNPAPRGLPPGTAPTTPYINFVPVQPGNGQ